MLWHRTESWESNYTFTRLRTVKCDHSLQPTDCSTLNYSHLLSWDPLKEKQLCRQKHVKNMELKEDFVAVTRDLEFWRDGGRKDRTLVGASFSMECLLCGAIRLSGWGVEDIGRNCGGTGEKKKMEGKNWVEEPPASQWHVFVGLQIQSSGYFMMVLTLFAHDGLWRCVFNQWGRYAGAAIRFLSVLVLLE